IVRLHHVGTGVGDAEFAQEVGPNQVIVRGGTIIGHYTHWQSPKKRGQGDHRQSSQYERLCSMNFGCFHMLPLCVLVVCFGCSFPSSKLNSVLAALGSKSLHLAPPPTTGRRRSVPRKC